MNSQFINKATSENFASIIISNYMLDNISVIYENASFVGINSEFSVAYIPMEDFNTNIIYEIGYEALPKCYGLMSVSSCNPMGASQLSDIEERQLTGQDVLVGFVDTGIDYRNLAFINEDNTSKIISIWDQTIDSVDKYPSGLHFGSEYRKEEINNALRVVNPLTFVPSVDEIGHGTVLASIAGGSIDKQNNFKGIAPNVEFVVVKLKPAKKYIKDFFCLQQDVISYQEDDIMFGINYIVQVAQEVGRPVAICMGIGTSFGVGIINDLLSSISRIGNVAIVAAAGNEGTGGHHYEAQVNPTTGYDDVELIVGDGEMDFFVKFVGNAPNVFSIDLFAPMGELVGRLPTFYTQKKTMEFKYMDTTILADNTIESTQTGDQCIPMRFINPRKGTWKFRVYGRNDMLSLFGMWLPIRNFISPQTIFANPYYYKTIVTPSNEPTILTVVAYNSINETLFYYNSIGFVQEKAAKPDVAAPGVNVWAPTSGNQYTWNTGTSVAAAHATGIAAMLLEWGIIRGNMKIMPSAKTRNILTGGARRLPGIIYPLANWGFGILDLENSINEAIKWEP